MPTANPFERLPTPIDDPFAADVVFDPEAHTWTRKEDQR